MYFKFITAHTNNLEIRQTPFRKNMIKWIVSNSMGGGGNLPPQLKNDAIYPFTHLNGMRHKTVLSRNPYKELFSSFSFLLGWITDWCWPYLSHDTEVMATCSWACFQSNLTMIREDYKRTFWWKSSFIVKLGSLYNWKSSIMLY